VNLRFALLGLLAAKPGSGFDIVRRFRGTAGYAWTAHHSQIYPELARCLREGLIEEVGAGPRGKRLYRTTQVGREQLEEWLGSEHVDRTVRSEPTLRSFFTWLMDPDAAASLYRREADYHRAQLDELSAIAADFADVSELDGPARSARITLERGLRVHAALAEWATWAALQSEQRSAAAAVAAGEQRQ
jgi:DNA-binding PadR family transcriptional regulator